jgi:hypothetical protein
MPSPNRTPKNAADAVAYCADQGIPNLVAAGQRGVSVQRFQVVVPALAVAYTLIFVPEGGVDMANADYHVQLTNHTHQGTGICDPTTRTGKQLVITSVVAADVLEVLVCGKLKGQL